MFDIKELKINEGASVFSGSAALKVLQNEHTFILDLLIRESIQNSSDAAVKDAPVFFVFYNNGTFVNENLSRYFDEKTEGRLNERYPSQCSYLEIRDANTVGLTGETVVSKRDNETKSNFIRLIFDMGKGQDQINAGGNWGYGKTVYYRLGNGIVIYYSRIKNAEGAFESRLMLTLVEHEENEDALLRTAENNSAGRAWWGEKVGNDICPIKDESIIKEFLDVFGVKEFGAEETGTSIIIPYVDEEKLMDTAKTGFKVKEEIERCTFLNSISGYLKYAIQKWYAPIINNVVLRKLGRKFLNASVNNEPVRRDDMYPVFQLVQELYTAAYAPLSGNTYQSQYPIVCKESKGAYKRHECKFGFVSFLKIRVNDLSKGELLLPPNVYMNLADDEYGRVVSLYTRDLGMILNYEESWIGRDFIIEDDEILMTLFVPNTSVVEKYTDKAMSLGEYLRQREESDHMRWDDDPNNSKIKCVKQIKGSVDTAVKKYFNPAQLDAHGESDMSEFAGVLGEKLFPRRKAKPKSAGGGGSGGGVSRSEKRFNFATRDIRITAQGHIKVAFDLELKEKVVLAIKTKISSDVAIDAEKWREKIGTNYPLKVFNFTLETQENESPLFCEESNSELIIGGERNKLKGTFEIEASDKKLKFIIDCEEKKMEDD